MLIGLVGPCCSGKTTLSNLLCERYGFQKLDVEAELCKLSEEHRTDDVLKILLRELTKRFRENVVLENLFNENLLEMLEMRATFITIAVDAPFSRRYARAVKDASIEMDKFLEADEESTFFSESNAFEQNINPNLSLGGIISKRSWQGTPSRHIHSTFTPAKADARTNRRMWIGQRRSLREIMQTADITILNSTSKAELQNTLDNMCKWRDLGMQQKTHSSDVDVQTAVSSTIGEWVRPTWDSYFMLLADLAARRSNCMKRRVGAIIVNNTARQVVSTGYNGTPRGCKNCNEGGCERCNAAVERGVGLSECLCIHAEENALLEAGRPRTEGCVLYCTTFPCLGCAKKIIQAGCSQVVYEHAYAADEHSKALLESAGLEVRQHIPPRSGIIVV